MKYPTNELYLSKNERHGLYFMLGCMLLIILTIFLVNNFTLQEHYEFDDVELIAFAEFANETANKNQKQIEGKTTQKHLKAFNFNPNTTPLDSLLMLPIPKYVAKRIDKYRSKGGKFKSVDDLGKIYGIEKHLSKISDYVKIPPKALTPFKNKSIDKNTQSVDITTSISSSEVTNDQLDKKIEMDTLAEKPSNTFNSNHTDSLNIYDNDRITQEKENLVMEINQANEYQLQMINGIGPYFSKKIVEFRAEVGGFYSLDQLRDIGMRDENFNKVISHLTCNPKLIRKRNINYTRQDSLGMIPGVGYKKSKIAVLYINNHFPLEGPEDLKKIKIFKDDEIELMLKYLKFSNE